MKDPWQGTGILFIRGDMVSILILTDKAVGVDDGSLRMVCKAVIRLWNKYVVERKLEIIQACHVF